MNSQLICLILLATVSSHSSIFAADLPAGILDLTNWKLTLPIETDKPGQPGEIEQPRLRTFVNSRYFFVDAKRNGIVFRAPCGGTTTKGSDFPRCELREMIADGSDEVDWSTTDNSTHTLIMRVAITQTPKVKQHVVCAQIHDPEDDLLMIRLEGKKLFIERNELEPVFLDRNYRLGTPFDLKIEAGHGRVKVWYDGEQKLDWKVSRRGCYFKAGCYTQSNLKKGDAADAFGEVVIDRLDVKHDLAR